MAKRSRLGSRPGQRRPLQRSTAKPLTPAAAAPRPAGTVTPEEEARAAELEAQILAEEKAAEDARKGRSRRTTAADAAGEATIYSSVPLAQRAAEEYGYVRRDLRRIAVVGGALLLVMVAIDVLLNVTNVV
ncbi:MAG TPA: hypothetical protein VFV72_15785 [Candidatus Limnocylindrales bacterium]|nr:hypothetical protein [Candidatus Limnocylindrales bacterium]